MRTLQAYLSNQKIDLQSFDLKFKIFKWLSLVKADFDVYRKFIVEPLTQSPDLQELQRKYERWFEETVFFRIVYDEINQYFSNYFYRMSYSREALIQKIQTVVDLHLARLNQHANWISNVFPLSPSINPFHSNTSGVEMHVYLKKSPQSRAIEIGSMVASNVGHDCGSIKKSHSKHFLQMHKVADKISYTHAEYKWFSDYLQVLIDELQVQNRETSLKKEVELQAYHDEHVLHHLDDYPRLEFVLSSSNCHDCRSLFPALRQILQQQDMNIPILIYARKPFNLSEISQSPLCLVNYQGQYIETGICIDMGYNNNCLRVGNQSHIKLDKIKAIHADFILERALIRDHFSVMDFSKKKFLAGLLHMICNQDKPAAHDLYWLQTWLASLPLCFYPHFSDENQLITRYVESQIQSSISRPKLKKFKALKEEEIASEVLLISKNPEKLGLFCPSEVSNYTLQSLIKLRDTWLIQSKNNDQLFFIIHTLILVYLKVAIDIRCLKKKLAAG